MKNKSPGPLPITARITCAEEDPRPKLTEAELNQVFPPSHVARVVGAAPSMGTTKVTRRAKGAQSLSSYILENTSDLTECAEYMIATLRGVTVRRGHPPSHKDSFEAAVWLADRAVGKAVDRSVHVSLTGEEASQALPELTTDELIQALATLGQEKTVDGTVTRRGTEETPPLPDPPPDDDRGP